MVLEAIKNFLLQPVVWLAILSIGVTYARRISFERKQFRIAINRDFFEGRHFIKNFFLLGIIGSLITILIGVMLPWQWIIIYQVLMVIAVLIYPFFKIDSAFFWWISLLLLGGLSLFSAELANLLPSSIKQQVLLSHSALATSSAALLFIAALFLAAKWLMLKRYQSMEISPVIKNGKRGRRLVFYSWQDLALVPLVCLVPSGTLTNFLPGWFFITIAHHQFQLFILPAIISSGFKFWRQSAQATYSFEKRELLELLLAFLVGAGLCYIFPAIFEIIIIVLLLLSVVAMILKRRFERKENNWYVETHDGVRVIAVQPNTPAAKMKIQPGDEILTCNGLTVHSESELYAALKTDATFCRFKLRNYAGELKLAQGAIYADSPHEIGLVIFH
ncbi:MAG: PDZ domain-containing protein [Liquorilactobacillus ghanensis]|uniref:PDZ domain-containing protein n=1 Tax=Liquorilactobacillus ghanensis TaxID=399370 RepID=UPI0039E9DB3E